MTDALPTNEAAALHERLLAESADYKQLVALADERIELVLGSLERNGRTLEEFISLSGELRGLRAYRGASTFKREAKKT